jgi:phenylacetate-CoA ligase
VVGDALRTSFDMENGGVPLRTAGLDCYVWMGETCGHSAGAHLHEDRAIVQAVDPATGKEVPHGEWGTLVVTTLGRDNGMIRYDLEEACKLYVEPCACGETTIRGIWGGRLSDLMMIQGKRMHSHQFEQTLRGVPDISDPGVEFQIVRPVEADCPVAIRIERGLNAVASDEDIAKTCRAHLKQALGVETDVTILPRETLPRSGYKVVRVVRQ